MRAWSPAPVFFTVVAVRFAEPVLDGDLFWRMKYARRMIDRGTLVTDHTIYSWTPASNAMIYCAWLAEFAFYAMWRLDGLALIFAFRYAAVLGAVMLQVDLSRRCGWKCTPLFWLILLVAVVSSYVGTLPKLELFSFLFFQSARVDFHVRQAGRLRRWQSRLVVLLRPSFVSRLREHSRRVHYRR